MRIMFVSNYYPPFEIGGYEQLCRDVALRLGERGHQIQILTSDRGAGQNSCQPEQGILRTLRLQPDYESRLGTAGQFFFTRRRDEIYNLMCLRRLADAFCPDVIFLWNLQGLPRSIAIEAEAIPNVGVAYWLAGYSPAEPDEFWLYWNRSAARATIKPFKSLLARIALKQMRSEGRSERPQMRHVAVVSEYMRQQGYLNGTVPPHAKVIYNGVELNLFYRPVATSIDGDLVLLQAGRVSVDKGVHTGIEAVGRLVQEYNYRKIHLYIAGTGPVGYLLELQRIVEQYNIKERVTFAGRMPREQLPGLMSKCHVLILPSEYPEAFSRVVLEAMASGLVVIGTLRGGTGEIVRHEKTGLTFPAGDSQELASQINRLLSDADLRVRLATQGQTRVLEQFSLERMIENIERLLEEAAADRGRSA
jgi:glycogen synthase